jgi:hypothetical protein
LTACASNPPEAGRSSPRRSATGQRTDANAVRDAEAERRAARLELRLMEKEAQVDELQTRLNDARDEVVRTMAKLQTLASRAEAASAMAEADVAFQTLRGKDGARSMPEMAQAHQFIQRSTSEFNKENYGGALYLANQAKSATEKASARLTAAARGTTRAGELPFAVPLLLKTSAKGNVREGPGTNFPVLFEASAGDVLIGYSYTDEWIRVADSAGRSGWIFRSLIARP